MPRAKAQGGMARGDRDVARRVKSGGFGAVPLGFATDATRGSAGSFTKKSLRNERNHRAVQAAAIPPVSMTDAGMKSFIHANLDYNIVSK
jgi:hypothetical protein